MNCFSQLQGLTGKEFVCLSIPLALLLCLTLHALRCLVRRMRKGGEVTTKQNLRIFKP